MKAPKVVSNPGAKRMMFAFLVTALASATHADVGVAQSRGIAPPPEPPAPIAVGQTVESALRAGGQKYFTVQLAAGQRVRIFMRSPEMDSVLGVGRLDDNGYTGLYEDDDGAGQGGDSMLLFNPETAGVYTLRAGSFGSQGAGAFTLEVQPRPSAQPPTLTPIRLGESKAGRLADGGPRLNDSDALYVDYALSTIEQNVRVRATLSPATAPFRVQVLQADGAPLRRPLPGKPTPPNEAYEVLREPGAYLIRVQARTPDSAGEYSLVLRTLPPPRATVPASISVRPGESKAGTLADTDPASDLDFATGIPGFKPYHLYQVLGEEGDEIVIDLASTEFDPVLDIGARTPGGFAVLRSRDDISTTDRNAHLSFKFMERGGVTLRVRPAVEGGAGRYTLSVTSANAPQAQSWDVDLFYCLGPGQEANRQRAQTAQQALTSGGPALGFPVGRVRLRELSEEINSGGGYDVHRDEVRFESGESAVADAMIARFATAQLPRVERKRVSPREPSKGYLSAFFCAAGPRR